MLTREAVIQQISQMPPTFSVDELLEKLSRQFDAGSSAFMESVPNFGLAKNQFLFPKLKDLELLTPNWDTYGAIPPTSETIKNAEIILRKLDASNMEASFIGPSPNAEVMIELVKNETSAEIYVFENKAEVIVFENGACLQEGNLETLLPILTQIFAVHNA